MRLNRWTVVWIVVVAALLVLLGFELSGLLTIADLIANPILFLVAFIVVAVLSAVGAMFIGVFVTHRIFASADFTPFEREMLNMREEVRQIREQVEEVVRQLNDEAPKD